MRSRDHGKRKPTAEGLAEELASLPQLDKNALMERWRDLYGADPPKYFRRRILMLGIAYKLRERVYGGLRPSTKALLRRVAEEVSGKGKVVVERPKVGTRLLREWQGRTHEVIVLDQGVLFEGERFRSLTEVAKRITGAHWSGPRFFGLRSPRLQCDAG
jgi:hypothetical protein